MDPRTIDQKLSIIADDILQFLPLFYRKILKMSYTNTGSNLINMQFHVVAMLMSRGIMPTSEIGRRLGISGPNVTSLIDRLIEQGYVKRFPDTADRRVIKIALTAKGKQFFVKRKKQINANIKNNLSVLQPEEVKTLYVAIEAFKKFIMEVDSRY